MEISDSRSFSLFLLGIEETLSKHIEKKRYAYLEVGNVGNSRLFREKGVMVLTRIAWAAVTTSLNKGYSYDLRLRTWHRSSTLEPRMIIY